MNKCFALILMMISLTSCAAKDASYFRSNPKELQKVLKACPNQKPRDLSCQQVEEIATYMNRLAYKLQYNPQGFGLSILQLQQDIAKQQQQLSTNSDNADLKDLLNKNKNELAEHLAVVKWLESPES